MARCSSTRSLTSRPRPRRSSFAPSKSSPSNEWEATRHDPSYARSFWWRLTRGCESSLPRDDFEPIFSIDWADWRFEVPPLRARRDDIIALATHFVAKHRGARDIDISASAMDALAAYSWPGNVRELERVVERAVTLASSAQVTLQDLPPRITHDIGEVLAPSTEQNNTMRARGRRYAHIVLERCQHQQAPSLSRPGSISYHTLPTPISHRHRASHGQMLTGSGYGD